MTIQFIEPPKYYYKDGFYWLVTGSRLIQFSDDFYNPWKPGTELYGCKRRELLATKPLDNRQGKYVWDLLKKSIKEAELEEQAA